MTQQPVEPILYDLAGDGIQITYTPATLTYTPSEASALRTVYSQEFRVVPDPK